MSCVNPRYDYDTLCKPPPPDPKKKTRKNLHKEKSEIKLAFCSAHVWSTITKLTNISEKTTYVARMNIKRKQDMRA